MTLTEQEAKQFFEWMWSLQAFVNRELEILDEAVPADAYADVSQAEKMQVRDALYAHPELIDRFVEQNPDQLDDEALAVMRSWKSFVAGTFFIERLLKKHAILINDDNVYGVLGLYDPFDAFFDPRALPQMVKAVLLPFRGRIIYDGLLQGGNLFFGSGISGELKERYLAAKQNRQIITSLELGAEQAEPAADDSTADERRQTLDALQELAKSLRATKAAPAAWSPAFSLVRASLELATAAVEAADDPDALEQAAAKVARALNRVERVIYRME